MSHIDQQALADLSRIDAHILQSELIVTRQQKRVDNLEHPEMTVRSLGRY